MATLVTPDGLLDAGIDMAYQPIVQLGSGSVIAYEALARPRHPSVAGPLAYLDELGRGGLRSAGERAALLAAVEGAHGRHPRTKLFVNASPSTLVDPDFDVAELLEAAQMHSLSPHDLVVEVTESEAINDLDALARRTEAMRRLGVGLAVDDAGAGHSSFRVITRLRPTFIKLDRDLVTSVDLDGARHAFIEAMVRFSRQIGSRLIAEGIETCGELVSLVGLGVDAGQGYFLARPTLGELGSPHPEARRAITLTAQRLRLGAAPVIVGELARPAAEVDVGCGIAEAHGRFRADPLLGLLVLTESVGDRARVVGQVSRRSLERAFSTPQGWSEPSRCTVGDIVNRQPLTVEAGLDVVEVAGIMGARHPQDVADDVLVSDPRGEIVGVVAVRDVLRTLARVHARGALDVHPLSGLPGRAWLEGELSRRLGGGDTSVMMVVEVDGFRRINDLGGFTAGDEVIRALGRCLGGVAAVVEGTAVAHVGADGFMVVVPWRRYDEVVSELVRRVESEVVPLVRTLLGLHPGSPEAGRLALSIAGVDLTGEPPPGHRYLEWAQGLLSPLMQTAKGHRGHACMHRSGESTALSTWTPRPRQRRKLAAGQVDPNLVLQAGDLVTDLWQAPWRAGTGAPVSGFAGGTGEMRRLLATYMEPLRARAEATVAAGSPVMDVVIEGDEEELLGLLDRIALVTRHVVERRHGPVTAEFAFLDRLLRQRSRTLVREDKVSLTGV